MKEANGNQCSGICKSMHHFSVKLLHDTVKNNKKKGVRNMEAIDKKGNEKLISCYLYGP